MIDDVWENGWSVYITSFWGWSPATWGTVGFTGTGRRKTIIETTTDPFLMVVYVTKSAPTADRDMLGKVTGFYVVSHIEGHRNAFTDSIHHARNPDKWQYSLKAIRAFSFLPEYRIHIDKFDPTLRTRAHAVAAYGEELGADKIALLKRVPYVEVPVFGGPDFILGDIRVPIAHKVKAGPVNRGGYVVPGEPPDTEKELYILVLNGDMSAFLGEAGAGRRIFKIGLSLSPKTRLEAFRKTLPQGAFSWQLHRSTRADGHVPYPSFEAAVFGETAIKNYLGQHGTWRGGEFYAATEAQIETAWTRGRKAALAWPSI
jgi:hypothetical protein